MNNLFLLWQRLDYLRLNFRAKSNRMNISCVHEVNKAQILVGMPGLACSLLRISRQKQTNHTNYESKQSIMGKG